MKAGSSVPLKCRMNERFGIFLLASIETWEAVEGEKVLSRVTHGKKREAAAKLRPQFAYIVWETPLSIERAEI